MTKKHTRKQRSTVKTTAHVQTVPELRRAFEHIDTFAKSLLKKPVAEAVNDFQSEWKRTFYRSITADSAKAYLDSIRHTSVPKKTRRLRGGAGALEGAPLDYQTRPGVYIQPAGLNENSYAQVPAYIASGFWNPAMAHTYDPVPGQTRYVIQTPPGMESNLVKGGGNKKDRRTSRRLRGGAALLNQAFSTDMLSQALSRVMPATIPPAPLQDAMTAFRGEQLGQSPDPTQTRHQYWMSPMSQAGPTNLAVGPINVNLTRDITLNK
jgi:hypothetical protein